MNIGLADYMKIGGFLELERNDGKLYYEEAIALNSARNCLRFLIRSKKIDRLFLPDFLCGVISDACREEGCRIFYYSIDGCLRIGDGLEDFVIGEDYLYIVNYCGILIRDEVLYLKRTYQNIILDNVQAFFAEPIEGVDTIYSCRKFFGVADGAFLFTNVTDVIEYERDCSYDRMQYILGRFELGPEEFYQLYLEQEEIFGVYPVRRMSALTENILRGLDYEKIAYKRTLNYMYLERKLKPVNLLKLPEYIYGAFSYPILIPNGERIRSELVRKKIFVPQLWKEVEKIASKDSIAAQMTNNIIWLPCDQRYKIDQMRRMTEIFMECLDRCCPYKTEKARRSVGAEGIGNEDER